MFSKYVISAACTSWFDGMDRRSPTEHFGRQWLLGQPWLPSDTLHPCVLTVGAVVCAPVGFCAVIN